MRSRSANIQAQTIKQAKADYRKYGPRVSSQESRRLERGAELFRRAEKIKDSERRRRAAIKKKQEKEQKERELRRSNGPSKPAASQALLESFVRLRPELAFQEQTTPPLPEVDPLNDEINESEDTDDTDDVDDMYDIDDQTMLNIRFSQTATSTDVDATSTLSESSRRASNTARSDVQTRDSAPVVGSREELAALHDLIGSISTQDVTLSPSDLKDLDFDRRNSTCRSTNIGARSSDKESPIRTTTSPGSKNRNLNMQISFTDFDLSTQDLYHLVD